MWRVGYVDNEDVVLFYRVKIRENEKILIFGMSIITVKGCSDD